MKEKKLPEIVLIDERKLKYNDDNPRSIREKDFNSLVKSLRDAPEMFKARPLLVSDRTGKLVVIGGNMRLRAARKIGMAEVPCIIIHGLTAEKEREIVIKDNGAWGEWDWEALANAWGNLPLNEWGLQIPEISSDESMLPGDKDEINTKTKSEVLIEIYCTKKNLKEIESILKEWEEIDGVTINIS